MTLQTSGPISLANLASEFGGTVPHSLSEYYKSAVNGYVPGTTISYTAREPSSGDIYSDVEPLSYWGVWGWPGAGGVYWNGTQITVLIDASTSYTVGGITYYRGTFRTGGTDKNGAYAYYGVYREVSREPATGEYYNGALQDGADNYWGTSKSSLGGTGKISVIRWNNTTLLSNALSENTTSWVSGNMAYFRGAFQVDNYIYKGGYIESEYAIYRTGYSEVVMNTNIPTSGAISLGQFYGGRKT